MGVFETKVLSKRKIRIYCLPRLQQRGLLGATLGIFLALYLGWISESLSKYFWGITSQLQYF